MSDSGELCSFAEIRSTLFFGKPGSTFSYSVIRKLQLLSSQRYYSRDPLLSPARGPFCFYLVSRRENREEALFEKFVSRIMGLKKLYKKRYTVKRRTIEVPSRTRDQHWPADLIKRRNKVVQYYFFSKINIHSSRRSAFCERRGISNAQRVVRYSSIKMALCMERYIVQNTKRTKEEIINSFSK